MAKKAKRRGRPLGSKNKKPFGSVETMEVAQLRHYINHLEDVLTKKVREQASFFESKLAELKAFAAKKTNGLTRVMKPRTEGRRKAEPKFQSKKGKSLKWSGRGALPRWMREEMKGTKLKREDFAIAA